MTQRPRLTPAMADVRRAVRTHLTDLTPGDLVFVALSGGPDSVALAAAVAFEAPRIGLKAGAIIIDHGLQQGSEEIAQHAATMAKNLGLEPVEVRRVNIVPAAGIEADARTARYEQFEDVVRETGAKAVLLGHSQDDQAETVLLGLTRGAGATSVSGMSPINGIYRRPLLSLRREALRQSCVDQGLEVWDDPHNNDPRFTRVRIRNTVIPLLEKELGPGITEALARTAQHLQEDTIVLDALATEAMPETKTNKNTMSVHVTDLENLAPAVRSRVIRKLVSDFNDVSLSSPHTEAINQLITDWHGQGEIHVPTIRVERQGKTLTFTRHVEPKG